MGVSKKIVWVIGLVILGIGFGSISGHGQDKYPSRGIDLVIPWAAGGSTDISARLFANELNKILKVPITSTNRVGASGTVGATYVHKARKDGYTLLGGSLGWFLSSMTLEGVVYDPLKDFIPVTKISNAPHGIFVKSDSPIKTLEDFVDRAKKSPGVLSCGHAGTASDGHFNIEIFQRAASLQLKVVPFKGNAEIPPAILGGHVDVGIGIASSWMNFVKAGNLRILGITGGSRLKDLPDVPTFKEKGYKQTFLINWVGLFPPAGVPQAVVDTLAQASEKVVKSKEFIEAIEKTGSSTEFLTPEEYRKVMEDEKVVAEKIALELGLKKGK